MEAAAFLLLANLQPRKTLAVDVLNLAGTGLALWWLLPQGVIAYLAGLLAVQALLAGISLVWLLQSGALEWRAIGQALTVPAIAACCVGLASRWVLLRSTAGALVFACVFGLVYLAALRLFCGPAFLELIEFLPGRRRAATLEGSATL
jgi:hypothetical protein